MKTFKPFLLLVIVASTFLACKTTSIQMQVMKPAEVNIPKHIKKLVVINRTIPQHKIGNLVEGILTGELPGQDKQAGFAAINGFMDGISQIQRFEAVNSEEMFIGSGAGGTFPPLFPWDSVSLICKKYNADAVVSLETFDSDYIITNVQKDVEKKDKNGNVYIEKQFHAEGLATVKLGFRLYDPTNNIVIDKEHYSHSNVFSANAKTATEAALLLLGKDQALKRVSSDAGQMYAKKISPSYIRVTRTFYKKAKKDTDIPKGARMAQVNDWEKAISIWTIPASSNIDKIAGIANYNIAVAYEMLGDLDTAVKYAQKAYGEYGNSYARNYVSILQSRIRDVQILEQQMED